MIYTSTFFVLFFIWAIYDDWNAKDKEFLIVCYFFGLVLHVIGDLYHCLVGTV